MPSDVYNPSDSVVYTLAVPRHVGELTFVFLLQTYILSPFFPIHFASINGLATNRYGVSAQLLQQHPPFPNFIPRCQAIISQES